MSDAVERPARPNDDDGSSLVVVLVAILVCSLLVVPMLTYATAVTRASIVSRSKDARQELVKGALRLALADPSGLYKECGKDTYGPNVPFVFPNNAALADNGTNIRIECYKLWTVREEDASQLRYGLTAVQVNAPLLPLDLPDDQVYQGSNYPNRMLIGSEGAWVSDSTVKSTAQKIWLPELAPHGLSRRSVTPFSMPAGFPTCNVYFPGTYTDDLVINTSTPTYFTSGIYYFEKQVRFSTNANVVIGAGSTPGCTSDQEAAFYATNAPATHNITGLGATFVFGDIGRLTIDTLTAGTTLSVLFNQRYVSDGDGANAPSAGVSVISVNGAMVSGAGADLNQPGNIFVPLSKVAGTPSVAATTQEYKVSTLVPTTIPVIPVPASVNAIVEINLTTTATVKVAIPGYVAVPQGVVKISVANVLAAANKDVLIGGGLLAASYEASLILPAKLVVGTNNPEAQKVFRIVATTISGSPRLTSTSIVKINSNGGWKVASFEVQ